MDRLSFALNEVLCPGMQIPWEFEEFFKLIEDSGWMVERSGYIFGWIGNNKKGARTNIQFVARGSQGLEDWFDKQVSDFRERVCVFAQTGAEGSMAAFWLDDNGDQQIVHLGSGCGSTHVCVLSKSPIDFLRLLAIGYDEICWLDEFVEPPEIEGEKYNEGYLEFRNWVNERFGVSIPEKGLDLVPSPSKMQDKTSDDPFWQYAIGNAHS